MIRNDRQFGIVRSRVERLNATQDELLGELSDADNKGMVELQLRAVRAEIKRMRTELDEYEALKHGRAPVGTAQTFDDLPDLLIRARIAAGLTQAELASRLGMKEQQIQRYEASGYESASLGRLAEIARALNVRLGGALPATATVVIDTSVITRRLKRVGFTHDFLREGFGFGEGEAQTVGGIAKVARVFHWDPEEVVAGDVELQADAVAAGYKKPARSSQAHGSVLSAYAAHLAHCVADAIPVRYSGLPDDPLELHERIKSVGEQSSLFASALTVVWEAGVPVLPLAERGGFDAGYWVDGGHPVIVLNSTQRLASQWLFNLLHEVGHVVADGEGYVWEYGPGHDEASGTARELAANAFATQAIFGGRSRELADRTLSLCGGKVALMQRAVRMVARSEGVDQGALAFNVAYRLQLEGQNWWGAAMNMQADGADPWLLARDKLADQVHWRQLDKLDVDILARALRLHPPASAVLSGGH